MKRAMIERSIEMKVVPIAASCGDVRKGIQAKREKEAREKLFFSSYVS
jgi:hypothetical protein